MISRELWPRALLKPLLGGPLRLPQWRTWLWGLRSDGAVAVLHEFRCVSTLPLWLRANSGLFWLAPAFFPKQCLHHGGSYVQSKFKGIGCGLQWRTRRGGRGLGFDAAAGISHEFRCVSTLPLQEASTPKSTNRYDFVRIITSIDLFWGDI